MIEKKFIVQSEKKMQSIGVWLSSQISSGDVIFLNGALGVGKSVFARGVIRGLGYDEIVKSPTYGIVEEYKFEKFDLFHFDLYRLDRYSDLLYGVGFYDYVSSSSVLLIEWAEKFAELPFPDFICKIEYCGSEICENGVFENEICGNEVFENEVRGNEILDKRVLHISFRRALIP